MLTGLAAFLAAASACNRDPAVVKLANATVPKAYYQTLSGSRTAVIAVTLDARGHVAAASVYQSTGSDVLDAAALDAAKRSAYAPGETDCAPSGGTFAVDFVFDGETAPATDNDCPHSATVVNARAPHPSYWPVISGGPIRMAVEVTIGPDGRLVDARIAQSSRYMVLDQAALEAARESTYKPKTIAVPVRRQAGSGAASAREGVVCKAVTASYLFRVTFDPHR
jgi:TonB family protein